MKKILTAIFLPAALSGCATLDEFTDRYSRGYRSGYGVPAPRSSVFSRENQNFGITRHNLLTRELFETRPRPHVAKDVRIVDFQSASQDIQKACTQTEHLPVIRQGASDSGDYRSVLIYDIDENGQIINTEIDANLHIGKIGISLAALNGVKRTKFLPPVFNDQRLYCRNVTDTLVWYTKNIITNVSIREVGPHVNKLEW
ncbi:MAG: hypothetical protein DI586_05920 [Micavibrio aeruginosavorus]|uniref:Lipoprotein n=1 Tax=Micavibrio aeruginosavorus TaxID=349221 RepID=A0A2W5FIB1_9BACT|nr:MAG: hypothetical protein DI586_05920 [Micavibrio aeruginosavorus]